ncbi:hypothetical protein BDV19DRAFT_387668 [Aspergillus venezuelensis]
MKALLKAFDGVSKPVTSEEVKYLASTGDYAGMLLKVIRRVANARDIKGTPRCNDKLAKELKDAWKCSYVDDSSNELNVSSGEEDGDDLEGEKSGEEAEQNGESVAATKKVQSTTENIQECLNYLLEEEEDVMKTINLDPQTVEVAARLYHERCTTSHNQEGASDVRDNDERVRAMIEKEKKRLPSLIPEHYKEDQEHIVKMMEFYQLGKDLLKQKNKKGQQQAEEGSMLDGMWTFDIAWAIHYVGFICNLYVRVRPIVDKPGHKPQFFDPLTGEDMPKECKPKPRHDGLDWHGRKIPRPKFRPRPGQVVPGVHITPEGMWYRAVSRFIALIATGNSGNNTCLVEPIPGGRGDLEFSCVDCSREMPEQDLPRSAYTGTSKTQSNPDKRKEVLGKSRWIAGLPKTIYQDPGIGEEHAGYYLAMDGQAYVGVGKVVLVGLNEFFPKYLYVEPVQGKGGGDYDFFYPETREWMASFSGNRRPGEGGHPADSSQGEEDSPFRAAGVRSRALNICR